MSFLGEIKRRKVFQVAAIYAVVAWLIIQIVDVVSGPLNLPDWFPAVAIVLLAIGFPIAVIFAWAFDLTPEGVVRDDGTTIALQSGGRRVEYVLIGLLVLVVGFMFADNYVLEEAPDNESVAANTVEIAQPGVANRQREVLPNSVAVLLFENLSVDPENAYFAAGIHDTILNELVKIADLTVIARTSVLRYGDGQTPISQIAEELNVETVMEGTVQYADGQVRITAQLIDPDTGGQLWSGNYDRDFADIFSIQSEIAARIAAALETEFFLTEPEVPRGPSTVSAEAFAYYFRAVDAFNRIDNEEGHRYLDQAIKLDPNFSLAYAQKAHAYAEGFLGFWVNPTNADAAVEMEQVIIDSAEQALELDPNLGFAYAALAETHMAHWRRDEAEAAFQRAYQLGPNDPDVLRSLERFKRYQGEYAQAVDLNLKIVTLDPNNASAYQRLGVAYRWAKDYDMAADSFRRALDLDLTRIYDRVNLAIAEAGRRNYDEAVRQLETVETLLGPDQIVPFRLSQMAAIYSRAGRPDDAQRMFATLEARATQEPIGHGIWARAYAGIGEYDEALNRIHLALRERNPGDVSTLAELAANTSNDPELDKPEFREALNQLWDSA